MCCNPKKDNFSILSLNAQSLSAKFNELSLLVTELKETGFTFSGICIQETWFQSNQDTSLFNLDDYDLEYVISSCSKHGGVACYIHKIYSYFLRDKNIKSKHWDGLFIDVFGDHLRKPVTIAYIYRPPKNNTNSQIQAFCDEIAPIITEIIKANTDSFFVGDFNINLLKINEREKIQDYLDLFMSQINLPTRHTRKSSSLIDHIFLKSVAVIPSACSGIIYTNISDRLPCFMCVETPKSNARLPKSIRIPTVDEESVQRFCEHVDSLNIASRLDADLSSNPNHNYHVLDDSITHAIDVFLPTRTVRFNKYRHKLSSWITQGLIRSTQNRDRLYRRLKETKPNSPFLHEREDKLQRVNKILKQSIRLAKKMYYVSRFESIKDDARKMWENIKMVLNNTKKSAPSPLHSTFSLTIKLNWVGLKSPTNLTSVSLTLVLILPTKFLIRTRTIFVDICYVCIGNHRFLLTILPQVMYPTWYRNWKQRIVLDMIECLLNCYKKLDRIICCIKSVWVSC